MRTFTLAEAARLVGTSRGTLYWLIKQGRLAYDPADGSVRCDVAERDRSGPNAWQAPDPLSDMGDGGPVCRAGALYL